MIQKIKANWVFGLDSKSLIKSIWIGPLLITWTHEGYPVSVWYETIDFSWYGWDYWQPQEVEWEVQNETDRI